MQRGPGILSYEDSLDVDGLTVTRGEGFTRIITPKFGGLRAFGGWTIFGILYFGIPLLIAVARSRHETAQTADSMVGFFFHVVILVTLVVVGLRRLNERLAFDVTHAQFIIRRLSPARAGKSWIYRRDAVRDIHVSRADPCKLVVRIAGADLMELYISRDRELVSRAAVAINAALAESVPAAAIPLVPASAVAQKPMQVGLMSTVLMVISVAAGVGVGVLATPMVGFFVFALIAAPVGIRYGTQKKDFWF